MKMITKKSKILNCWQCEKFEVLSDNEGIIIKFTVTSEFSQIKNNERGVQRGLWAAAARCSRSQVRTQE